MLTYAGSLTGDGRQHLALIMVLLVSRIPFVERIGGLDGLIRLHRLIAPWPITLLLAHALFITRATRRPPGLGPGTKRGRC